MKSFKFYLLLLLIIALIGCCQKKGKSEWKINDLEYLEAPGFNVLVFHDQNPEFGQGGIEFIHHGERTAANGLINIARPVTVRRVVDKEKREIQATVEASGSTTIDSYLANHSTTSPEFKYTIRIWPEDKSIHLVVDLEKPIPAELKGKVTFDLRLFPVTYRGKTYQLGDQFGVIPVEGLDPMITIGAINPEPMSLAAMAGYNGSPQGVKPVPLAQGPKLLIAPEDPTCKLQIEQVKGNLSLIDGRNSSLGGWIIVSSVIPEGLDKEALEWIITPNLIPDWIRNPVISHSQVGYHPSQLKQAIIELDGRSDKMHEAILHRMGNDGITKEIKSGIPKDWGKFLRYRYAIFDFSEIKEPGLYTISYGNSVTKPFRISKDVYQQKVWQPTLEIFFPVQMCHMRVHDRWRVWHGACHLDDALQAPLSTVHVDGFKTYTTTETKYKPFQTIPGLNRGGWHDAGDNDLAAGSQATTTMYLALAGEEFGINVDQTTVMQDELFVEVRRPDGIPDLQQQLEHGVINLLSGYRASGHAFVGIIETSAGRVFLGDVASESDQKFFDSSVDPGEVRNNRFGKADDRWVVTNKDTGLEYQVAAALAAASRSLQGFDDALADECIETAVKAWNYEQTHEPVRQPNAYVPRNTKLKEILATVELLYTTREEKYASHLVSLWPSIEENMNGAAWGIARVEDQINNDDFLAKYREALKNYSTRLDSTLATNPFGVPWRPRIWGVGWNIQQFALEHFYLVKKYPDLFNRELVFRVVNFVLGCHPGSNTSLVSAVGVQSLTVAYGFNMHWWSYIPGGMASGTALIRPDFPELKEPYPYFAHQAEYVIGGAASYIFCILAADKMMNE
ncbi:glycoside hydrolase family 9 protein [Bacteroidota bacterium]